MAARQFDALITRKEARMHGSTSVEGSNPGAGAAGNATKRFRGLPVATRRFAPALVALLAAVAVVAVPAGPAAADDVHYPCAGVVSTVYPGTTYYQHAVSCVQEGQEPLYPWRPCGSWLQDFYLTWNMQVDAAGVLVRHVTLHVWHNSGEAIFIENPGIVGGNQSYYFNRWQVADENSTNWSKPSTSRTRTLPRGTER